MALITFSGIVDADPALVDSRWPYGAIARFTVVEHTGRYGKGDWVEYGLPTRRIVETDVQSAERTAATLKAGCHVMVTVREHTERRAIGGVEQLVSVVRSVRVGVLITLEQDVRVERNDASGSWWPSDV